MVRLFQSISWLISRFRCSKWYFRPNPKNITLEGMPLSSFPQDLQEKVLRTATIEEMIAYLRCGFVLTLDEWRSLNEVEWELFKEAQARVAEERLSPEQRQELQDERLDKHEGRPRRRWRKVALQQAVEDSKKIQKRYAHHG